MKRLVFPVIAAVTLAAAAIGPSVVSASGQVQEASSTAAPIYGVTIPGGYRDWSMVSVASVGDPVKDLRVKLGNAEAMKALKDGNRPFPDGTVIARLAYRQTTSELNNAVFGAAAAKKGLPQDAITKLLAG